MRTLLWLMFPGLLSSGAVADTAVAYFIGGCFWCMESNYQEQDGVEKVVSGATLPNPSYKGNHEGQFEAIEVT